MKIVHTVHGLPFHRHERWWRNRLYVALERRAARRSDAIISVADAMTAQALPAEPPPCGCPLDSGAAPGGSAVAGG